MIVDNKKDIDWVLIALYLLQIYILPEELFFLFSCGILFFLLLQSKWKATIPHIPGWNIYVSLLVAITVIGVIKYPIRFVVRDVFYEFNNIILVYIGYLIYKKNNSFRRFFSTFFLSMGLVSTITLISAVFTIIAGNRSFAVFRQSFANGIKPQECFFPIFSIWILIFKKTILSKAIDRMILIVCIVQIVANLSRTTLLAILVNYVVTILFLNLTGRINKKQVSRVFSTSIVIALGFAIILKFMPTTALEQFYDKVMRSFTEVSSKQVFSSIADANKNWRGYEISKAIEQWRQSSVINKIIGAGNGTLIGIDFVPEQWKGIIQNLNGISGVTVLHNSYYTLLVKGGVITVFSFCMIFIGGIRKGIRFLKKSINDENIIIALALVMLCCTMLIDAYITRGMVQNDAQFLWSISFGWINANIYREVVNANE